MQKLVIMWGLLFISSVQTAIITGTVESLTSPLGLATDQPRFSWVITESKKRNLTQTGYRVLISTSEASATISGDICDSGAVLSSQSSLVECSAESLAVGAVFWWSVQANLSDGSSVDWMAPQRYCL